MTKSQSGSAIAGFDPAGLRVGDSIPDFEDKPTSRTDIVRYQGASGDMNPIHHDDGYAALGGYSSAFSVGMLQAGVLGTYLADLFGPASIMRFRTQFREQVWPGDALTYRGTVSALADGVMELELQAVRQNGGVHIYAWATVRV
jgi:acyl dehydratase